MCDASFVSSDDELPLPPATERQVRHKSLHCLNGDCKNAFRCRFYFRYQLLKDLYLPQNGFPADIKWYFTHNELQLTKILPSLSFSWNIVIFMLTPLMLCLLLRVRCDWLESKLLSNTASTPKPSVYVYDEMPHKSPECQHQSHMISHDLLTWPIGCNF